jgi:hypothetical protein
MSLEIDHDQLTKALIRAFFLEFLELFVPDLAELIDPDSIQFLQQEYFTDVVEGEEKIIDLLAEVKLAGNDATILIHIEAESTRRSVFPQRLFFYFSLLHQQHLKPIYPIALFTYNQPKTEGPNHYTVEFPQLPKRRVLEFNFEAIQLNRLDWRAYLNSPNPIAAALMAKMQIEPGDRPKVCACW